MRIVQFVPALVATLAIASSAAFAAGTTTPRGLSHSHVTNMATNAEFTAQHCAALQNQFDGATKSGAASDKATAALTLRQEGAQLCAAGKNVAGVGKLEQALQEIGVTPLSPKG